MSLLGAMIIEGSHLSDEFTLKYSFEDYVVKGYTGQDNIQVGALVKLIINRIIDTRPQIKKICLQSDNASCFCAKDLIPYIYFLNSDKKDPRLLSGYILRHRLVVGD